MADEAGKTGASKKLRAVIDRIEDNDLAVLQVGDDGKTSLDVPLSLLPDGASDGDHLQITIALDKDSRRAATERVSALQERLAKRGGSEGKKDFKL
ncbi:MAG TPA: DUF3006 domain-containing protein [Pyrinomonadaceae bacterium]|nr:DUF3006 domain-containing protein [Pyrinomonadaceae bacterium]